MKIKSTFHFRVNRGVGYYLISVIFLLILSFSMFNILLWSHDKSGILKLCSKFSLLGAFACELAYLLVHMYAKRRFTVISVVAFAFIIYEFVITMLTNRYGIVGFVIDGAVWPLTFVTFELYAMYTEREVIRKQLHPIMLAIIPLCTLLLITNIRIHLNSTNHGENGGNVGPVYFLLSFMGLILLLGSKKEKLIFAVWFSAMILASTKRGGFVILATGLCGYYIINQTRRGNFREKLKKYAKFIVLGVAVAIIVYYIMVQMQLEILDRLLNMQEDEGSGRFEAWAKVLLFYRRSGLFKKIFGHGFHAVPFEVKPLGHNIYAHDSYLETLYDFGLVGVTVLIIVVLWLCVQALKLIKSRNPDAAAITYTLVEILVLSLIGYFFDESRFILCVAIVWGIALGNNMNYREKILRKIKEVIPC